MGSQLSLSKVAKLWLKGRATEHQDVESTRLVNSMLADRAAYVIDVGRLVRVSGQPSSDSSSRMGTVEPSTHGDSGEAAASARVAQLEQQLREAQRELEWMHEKVALKDQIISGLEAQIKLLADSRVEESARDHRSSPLSVEASAADAAPRADDPSDAEAGIPVLPRALSWEQDAPGRNEPVEPPAGAAATDTALSDRIGDEPRGASVALAGAELPDLRLDDVPVMELDESAWEPPQMQDEASGADGARVSPDFRVSVEEQLLADAISLDEPFEPALDVPAAGAGKDPSELLFQLPQDLLDITSDEPAAPRPDAASSARVAPAADGNVAETAEPIAADSVTTEAAVEQVHDGRSTDSAEQDWSLPDFSSSSESDWSTVPESAAAEPAVEPAAGPAAAEPNADEFREREPAAAASPAGELTDADSFAAASLSAASSEAAPALQGEAAPALQDLVVAEPTGHESMQAGPQVPESGEVARSEWDVLESELDTLKHMLDAQAEPLQASDPAPADTARAEQPDPFAFDLDIPELTLDMRILPDSPALDRPGDESEPVPEDAESDISALAQRKLARAQAMARMSAEQSHEPAPVGSPGPDKEMQDYLAASRQRRWALWRNKTK